MPRRGAILKHNTPCGVGGGASPLEAYRNAFATDPGVAVRRHHRLEPPVRHRPRARRSTRSSPKCCCARLQRRGDGAADEEEEPPAAALPSRDRIPRDQLDWKRVYGGVLLQDSDTGAGGDRGLRGRDGAQAQRRRAARDGVRLAGREAREEQRDRLRRRGPHARDRGRGDVAGRRDPPGCREGDSASGSISRGFGACERRVLPVPRRRRSRGPPRAPPRSCSPADRFATTRWSRPPIVSAGRWW